MSYTIVKRAKKPVQRIVIPAPEAPQRYYVKSNNTPRMVYRYVDDSDEYEAPVIIQKAPPKPKYKIINRSKSSNRVLIEDEEESDDYTEDTETYYYIDGKYYKPAPTTSNNTVFVKPQPQPQSQIYYVAPPKPKPTIVYVNQDRY